MGLMVKFLVGNINFRTKFNPFASLTIVALGKNFSDMASESR